MLRVLQADSIAIGPGAATAKRFKLLDQDRTQLLGQTGANGCPVTALEM